MQVSKIFPLRTPIVSTFTSESPNSVRAEWIQNVCRMESPDAYMFKNKIYPSHYLQVVGVCVHEDSDSLVSYVPPLNKNQIVHRVAPRIPIGSLGIGVGSVPC